MDNEEKKGIPTWKIIVCVLIVLDIVYIGYLSTQYCFTYKNPNTGEKIHECGDKTTLEKKYAEYLKQTTIKEALINTSIKQDG